ncbi:MAG: type II secretion system GspH family protein [Candidatus Gastranaerophilales bacterium]|nr:type II secretion system GspH family protein [Candidatus Gastranaerophilales bacterium]
MKKNAFTLSEVLITLVIVGIIAAITVPTLMANYRKQATLSKLKKFHSTLANAVKLTELDNGIPFSQWSGINNSLDWWNENIGKYMPVVEIAENKYEINDLSRSGSIPSHLYMLNDGTTITEIGTGCCGTGKYISIWYDTNGAKGPNQWGRDIFQFNIRENEARQTLVGANFHSRGTAETRERLLNYCRSGNLKGCTELIMRDGWEFKSDYPFSI